MNKKLITGAAGVILASCVGLGIALPAQADTLDTARTAVASDAGSRSTDSTNTDKRGGHGHGRGLNSEALADKLGLAEADVSAALDAVRDNTDRGERPTKDATEEEREAAKDDRRAALVTALAAELDVDEDTLASALTELRAEHEAEHEANPDAPAGDRGAEHGHGRG